MASTDPSEAGRPSPRDLKGNANAEALLYKTELTIRVLIGAIAIATLGTLLIAQRIVDGPIGVRGSISAYYHSGLRDLFVGAVWAVGTLLIAYKAAEPKGWEFRASLVAGIGALGLATFPTGRPGLPHNKPSCSDASSLKVQCTWLQNWLHEDKVEYVHYASTGLLVLGLAAICWIFAGTAEAPSEKHVYRGCLVLMAAAALLLLTGLHLRLYYAELMFLVAFAVAWFYKGRVLFKLIPGIGPRGRASTAGTRS
jgi:hypothetical protein